MTNRTFFVGFIPERFCVMKSLVFGLGQNLKVFWSIIKFVMVYMMNNLAWFKSSTKHMLHNKSLFWHSSVINLNKEITVSDCTRAVSSPYSFSWVTMLFKSLIMLVAIPESLVFILAPNNGACSHNNTISYAHGVVNGHGSDLF